MFDLIFDIYKVISFKAAFTPNPLTMFAETLPSLIKLSGDLTKFSIYDDKTCKLIASFSKKRDALAPFNSSAINFWFSATTIIIVGNPKQQRSQEVAPAAPMARSLFAINSAMLFTPTLASVFQGIFNACCCTSLTQGAVVPITTEIRQDEGNAQSTKLLRIWVVILSLSTPPRLISKCSNCPFSLRLRLYSLHSANSGLNNAYCAPQSSWQCSGARSV